MDTHEAARRRIYERTRDTWDEDTAEAFMTALPSTAELATRHDLDLVRKDIELLRKDFEISQQRLAVEFHEALASTMKALFFGLSGLMISLAIATNVFG